MYVQFLVEDMSTKILVNHIMNRLVLLHHENLIEWNIKPFKGIGHLPKMGRAIDRKTGQLLNDLPMYLRAFNHILGTMQDASLFIIVDNDDRNQENFKHQLEAVARDNMILADHVFCIAVKEMEAWLLGDLEAITKAYPNAKTAALKNYEQDGICDTWQVLANMVYPGGLTMLKRKAKDSYSEIGKMKAEWADKIGKHLNLDKNNSLSFKNFLAELNVRIEKSVS